MSEVVAFADVEAELVSTLNALLAEPVSTIVPPTRPDSFVRLSRVGGTRRDLISDAALVVFECWAPDTVTAADLARRTRAYVHSFGGEFVGALWVYSVTEVGGPSLSPDPTSETPRYVFSVQIAYRGVPLP